MFYLSAVTDRKATTMVRSSLYLTGIFAGHEGASSGFSTEHMVVLTNFLLILVSGLLTYATLRASRKELRKERADERRFMLRLTSLFLGTKNTDAHHRKD